MGMPAIAPTEVTHIKVNQDKRTSLLAQITIFYNLIEGMVSVFFGATDETLSLFGFGIDSIGAILIAIFSFREGRESFAKSRGESCHCDHCESS
jgi:hypothetical protein